MRQILSTVLFGQMHPDMQAALSFKWATQHIGAH